ncbi:MAG: MFS transporter [Proteobacteria bacterium]|nr:MFS transporter [Pseudomonadota bacterium]
MVTRLWIMWLCAALFYGYQYVLRAIPSVLKSSLEESFHFDPVLFGQFAGVYFIGYTLAHIPLGLLLDRFGPRRILPFAAFLSSVGMLPLLITDDFYYAILGRFILGLGSSCAFIGLVKVVNIAFAPNKFHKMLSLGSVFGLVGGVFAGAPVHYLMQYFGWKSIIAISICVGISLSLVMYLVLPKSEKEDLPESTFILLKEIFQNKWVWTVAIAAGFMVGPFEGYADAWAMQSLKSIYELSDQISSQSVSLIYLGFALGLPGLSFCSDKIGLDKTIILSGVFMILSFLTIISGLAPFWLLIGSVFLLGFFSSFQVPALCRATTFTSSKATSLTTALANTVIMFFGMFFHSILGGCVSYFSDIMPAANGRILSTCNTLGYQKSFVIIPVMLILGTSIFLFLNVREKNKKA